jgi:hypothetical protein
LFLGGAPEATASPANLSRAGSRPKHSGVCLAPILLELLERSPERTLVQS